MTMPCAGSFSPHAALARLRFSPKSVRQVRLIQLTDRLDLSDWSIYPSHDGSAVFFTAGTSAWRLDLETLEEWELVNFATTRSEQGGTVQPVGGTTGLSYDDLWWAVRFNVNETSALAIINTETGEYETILRRDSVGHLQFCPDDSDLLFYGGSSHRPCLGNSAGMAAVTVGCTLVMLRKTNGSRTSRGFPAQASWHSSIGLTVSVASMWTQVPSGVLRPVTLGTQSVTAKVHSWSLIQTSPTLVCSFSIRVMGSENL